VAKDYDDFFVVQWCQTLAIVYSVRSEVSSSIILSPRVCILWLCFSYL